VWALQPGAMDAFSETVLDTVSQNFIFEQPFHLFIPYAQLCQCGAVDCETEEFAACLDLLVVARHLIYFLSELNDVVYSSGRSSAYPPKTSDGE
jgi:hypothetical protein